MNKESNDKTDMESGALVRKIKDACANSFGVLESRFLCQSVSVLDPKAPLTVAKETSLDVVIKKLQSNKSGCAIVTDDAGKVCGIFTERDCLLKVTLASIDLAATPVATVMTVDPVCEKADTTIAYALNLMSVGGFRHIPVVDSGHTPIGLISVKDVVDYIVGRMTEDLLAFDTIG